MANENVYGSQFDVCEIALHDIKMNYINLAVDRDNWMKYAKDLEQRWKESMEALDKATNLLSQYSAHLDI